MADSLTDAQKLIGEVLDRLNVGSYTDHAYLAVEIDKALGGLTRERRIGTPGRRDINPHSRFAGGWTPEETL